MVPVEVLVLAVVKALDVAKAPDVVKVPDEVWISVVSKNSESLNREIGDLEIDPIQYLNAKNINLDEPLLLGPDYFANNRAAGRGSNDSSNGSYAGFNLDRNRADQVRREADETDANRRAPSNITNDGSSVYRVRFERAIREQQDREQRQRDQQRRIDPRREAYEARQAEPEGDGRSNHPRVIARERRRAQEANRNQNSNSNHSSSNGQSGNSGNQSNGSNDQVTTFSIHDYHREKLHI